VLLCRAGAVRRHRAFASLKHLHSGFPLQAHPGNSSGEELTKRQLTARYAVAAPPAGAQHRSHDTLRGDEYREEGFRIAKAAVGWSGGEKTHERRAGRSPPISPMPIRNGRPLKLASLSVMAWSIKAGSSLCRLSSKITVIHVDPERRQTRNLVRQYRGATVSDDVDAQHNVVRGAAVARGKTDGGESVSTSSAYLGYARFAAWRDVTLAGRSCESRRSCSRAPLHRRDPRARRSPLSWRTGSALSILLSSTVVGPGLAGKPSLLQIATSFSFMVPGSSPGRTRTTSGTS